MRTTPVDVIDASVPSSLAVVSISANRSSWSRATLSSSAWVRRDDLGELEGVPLVELEDGDVRLEPAR